METIADSEKWIGTMRSELGHQVITVKKLGNAFTESYIQLIRHDQVARLSIFKSRIMEEVENIRRMESASQFGSTKGALLGGGVVFSIGSLIAAAKGRKDAFDIGARMAVSVLSRKVPFGKVFITIGRKGFPEDVKVISVSRLARESNRSESEVKASLKDKGYLLITPEQFAELLDQVKQAVLDGSVCLPLARSEVMNQITRR